MESIMEKITGRWGRGEWIGSRKEEGGEMRGGVVT